MRVALLIAILAMMAPTKSVPIPEINELDIEPIKIVEIPVGDKKSEIGYVAPMYRDDGSLIEPANGTEYFMINGNILMISDPVKKRMTFYNKHGDFLGDIEYPYPPEFLFIRNKHEIYISILGVEELKQWSYHNQKWENYKVFSKEIGRMEIDKNDRIFVAFEDDYNKYYNIDNMDSTIDNGSLSLIEKGRPGGFGITSKGEKSHIYFINNCDLHGPNYVIKNQTSVKESSSKAHIMRRYYIDGDIYETVQGKSSIKIYKYPVKEKLNLEKCEKEK